MASIVTVTAVTKLHMLGHSTKPLRGKSAYEFALVFCPEKNKKASQKKLAFYLYIFAPMSVAD